MGETGRVLRIAALVVPPVVALVVAIGVGAQDDIVGIAFLGGLLVGVLAWANLGARRDASVRAGTKHPLTRLMDRTRRD